MKKVLCSVLLCAGVFYYAQTGTLSGNINDNSKIALPGAKITLSPGNIFTTSDENGNFVFLNVPTGNYTMRVDYIGYGVREYPVTVSEKANTRQDIVYDRRVVDIQEVKVYGYNVQSQARALNAQKTNSNITNVVSSDQIGKFPDANIGDALKRIPGVTMQNDQGEARNIIIRGLAPSLNSVTLNGSRIPSAEGDNRNVQMDLIPSDMIQLVEVNKTLTSDQDADAIGGSVNLNTKTAPNKERISLTTASGYNGIRDKFSFSDSFMYGNRFFGGKLGWVLNGSYNNVDYGSDNVEGVWNQDKKGAYISEMDIRKYDVKRERKSIGTNFDIKLNDKNTIRLNAMYNWRDDWENRYRLRFNKVSRNIDKKTGEDLGFKGDLRAQTKGGILNDLNDGARLERQIMQNYSIKGDHILGSKIDMDWGASYSKASEERPNERYIDHQAKGVTFDKNFDTEEFPLLKMIKAPSLSDYKFRVLSEQNGNTFEEEITGKLNFRFPFSIIEDQKGRLRVGGKMRMKFKKRENDFQEYAPINNPFTTFANTPTVFWGGENWTPDTKYVPGYFVSKEFLGTRDLKNSALYKMEDIPAEYLGLNYRASEDILSGYVRWDQNFTDKLSMILGVRVENTKTDYSANVFENEEDLQGTRTIENSYTNVLPSASLKYNVNNNFVLRGAFTTALARPNYYQLSPYVSILADDEQIDAGNSNLKATYAYNYDVMAEYYFKNVGLFSVGAFYKKLKDFIYVYRDKNYTHEEFAADFPDLNNPISTNPDATPFEFKQARNGDKVNVYGFEAAIQRQLDFLLGFMKNFGIYLNYTYTHSEAEGINAGGNDRKGLMLPGTAPHMFNGSLSWENKKFSARVSLNHTAAYLDELGGEEFEDRYYDKQTFLDANASYAITDWMRVFVEANNLTNQPLRYYQGVQSRTMQMEYYKPRYTFGLKFDF